MFTRHTTNAKHLISEIARTFKC